MLPPRCSHAAGKATVPRHTRSHLADATRFSALERPPLSAQGFPETLVRAWGAGDIRILPESFSPGPGQLVSLSSSRLAPSNSSLCLFCDTLDTEQNQTTWIQVTKEAGQGEVWDVSPGLGGGGQGHLVQKRDGSGGTQNRAVAGLSTAGGWERDLYPGRS